MEGPAASPPIVFASADVFLRYVFKDYMEHIVIAVISLRRTARFVLPGVIKRCFDRAEPVRRLKILVRHHSIKALNRRAAHTLYTQGCSPCFGCCILFHWRSFPCFPYHYTIFWRFFPAKQRGCMHCTQPLGVKCLSVDYALIMKAR